jgi:transposase
MVHVILDNYGTKAPQDPSLARFRHPRFVFHRIPKLASWLNAVEGLFAKSTRRRLKGRVRFDLQAAIKRFLAGTNDNPKPFVWTAEPNAIIATVSRGYQVLDPIH